MNVKIKATQAKTNYRHRNIDLKKKHDIKIKIN